MISITGSSSVLNRTIFTNKGPIVKSPLSILSGNDLYITSPNEVRITSGNFDSSHIGKTVTINGSPNGRNDGVYYVNKINSYNKLQLEANFDYSDHSKIIDSLITLSNDLKLTYNKHIVSLHAHSNPDILNPVQSEDAVDLNSICILLNDIKFKLSLHSILVGIPQVHKFSDPDASVYAINAHNLQSAVILANELKRRYEAHRQDIGIHINDDFVNQVRSKNVKVFTGSGSLVGPFNWIIQDPRNGIIADDPSDVGVLVNGVPAPVEYVFGLLGAIVLENKPNHGDSVLVDYRHLKNPPTQFSRLNSFEFVLNQDGNKGMSGIPGHAYRQRSYLINPGDPRLVKSPISPEKIGWKYKAFELAYTSRLNDPSSLLLNCPTNRIMFPALNESVSEKVVNYDPTSLPDLSIDKWNKFGEGVSSISNGFLVIQDSSRSYGSNPGSPFYSHDIDLSYPSDVSAAFRFYSEYSDDYEFEGVFNGVGFGFTVGQKLVLVGCLLTDANNLTSAISLANSIKQKYSNHLLNTGVHIPDDQNNYVQVVDAYDLDSLIRLTNHLVFVYNNHLSSGPNLVHKNQDITNTVGIPDANNLNSAINLLNLLRNSFNSHLMEINVHYSDDITNDVNKIKQVGLLINGEYVEDVASWTSFAYDWSVETTYRISISETNDVGLYLSGDSLPRITVNSSNLSDSSNFDLRFDKIFQVFFGSVGDSSSNKSFWKFIRVDVLPVNTSQTIRNKNVSYNLLTIPELDPDHPWISIGQGGREYTWNNSLIVDSVASYTQSDSDTSGKTTGGYRGFLRIEPSVTDRNVVAFEFSLAVPFNTFGIDNKSLGVFIGDSSFATQLCFLQANPSPASVTGNIYEPHFAIQPGDKAVFTINDSQLIVVTSAGLITTVTDLVNLFNTTVGYQFAVEYINPFTLAKTIKFVSPTSGSESKIRIISGEIFQSLGIDVGVFIYGYDSKPESKMSWCGLNLPDLDDPAWFKSGSQLSEMKERTLIINDTSSSDYISYTQNNNYVMGHVVIPNEDWKVDFKLAVKNFTPGDVVQGYPYKPCGALVSIDEGPYGKNVEVHLSVDLGDQPYVTIFSYNPLTQDLVLVSSYPFAWDDGEIHTYNLFTDKVNDAVSVFVDGVFLGLFQFSSLNSGSFGPSVTFGSGGNPTNNCDLRTSKSDTEWKSVSVIHDSSVGNQYLADNRYVGLYRGGDVTKLSSYYLSKIDWRNAFSYRIVRDPVNSVSVYISDGMGVFNSIPSISASFDVLTLPLSVTDFLSGVVPSGRFIAWGSFNSNEISRSIWTNFISYSIGKMTDSDGLVPPHQILNQANVISSPEHLATKNQHQHFGFHSYSGGTPTDDFIADSDSPFTVLGTGTPPVPMSQSMDSLGGLDMTVTPIESIPTTNIVYQNGSLANFINDEVNSVDYQPINGYTSSVNQFILDCSDLRSKYLSHISSVAPIHNNPDLINNIVTIPVDLNTCIDCLIDITSAYNSHLTQFNVHFNDDTLHACIPQTPTDLESSIALYNSLYISINSHINSYLPHIASGSEDFTLSYAISSLNLLKDKMNTHFLNSFGNVYHVMSDSVNSHTLSSMSYATDFVSAISLCKDLKNVFNSHLNNINSHLVNDAANICLLPYPNDLQSLYNSVSELESNYNLHIPDLTYHPASDITNTFVPNSNNEYLVRYLTDLKSSVNQHVVNTILHSSSDPKNQILESLVFHLNGQYTACDSAAYCDFTNKLKSRLLDHFISEVHLTDDFVSFDILNSGPSASDFATAMGSVLLIIQALSRHNDLVTSETQAHNSVDSVNHPVLTNIYYPLPILIEITNVISEKVHDHIQYKPSHIKLQDDYQISICDDLPSCISLLNYLKQIYNDHLSHSGVHVKNDISNVITAIDATSMDSAVNLCNGFLNAFNLHRVEPGVHSSSAIIRLTPPSGSLYTGIKFWNVNSGTPNITSSFSDDETLYFDGFQNQKVVRLEYNSTDLPEFISITGANKEPFDLGYRKLSIVIDQDDPIIVNFQNTDILASDVVNRINSTLGIPASLASETLDGRVILTNPNSGQSRRLSVTGSAASVIGLDSSLPIPWALVADDIGSVSVAVLPGAPNYLSYGTSGPGTITSYELISGLFDNPSLYWEIQFKIRIDSWSYDPSGDTGIYIGCNLKSIKLGIGFMDISGNKTIILRDMETRKILSSKLFNWANGSMNTYKLSVNNDSYSLEVV